MTPNEQLSCESFAHGGCDVLRGDCVSLQNPASHVHIRSDYGRGCSCKEHPRKSKQIRDAWGLS